MQFSITSISHIYVTVGCSSAYDLLCSVPGVLCALVVLLNTQTLITCAASVTFVLQAIQSDRSRGASQASPTASVPTLPPTSPIAPQHPAQSP
jgi:hypothetical protein